VFISAAELGASKSLQHHSSTKKKRVDLESGKAKGYEDRSLFYGSGRPRRNAGRRSRRSLAVVLIWETLLRAGFCADLPSSSTILLGVPFRPPASVTTLSAGSWDSRAVVGSVVCEAFAWADPCGRSSTSEHSPEIRETKPEGDAG
jgi:hypothetical protein